MLRLRTSVIRFERCMVWQSAPYPMRVLLPRGARPVPTRYASWLAGWLLSLDSSFAASFVRRVYTVRYPVSKRNGTSVLIWKTTYSPLKISP